MSSAEHEIRAVADLSARRTREQAWRQFAAAASAEEYCASWLAIQAQLIGEVSDGVVVLQKPGAAAMVPVAFLPESPLNRTRLAEVTERALKERQGVVLRLEAAANDAGVRCQLAHPVQLDGELRGVVGLELEPRSEPQVRSAMRELQWGSGWLEVLLRRHAQPQDAARLRLKLALDVVAALLEHEGLDEGGAALATELATRLGCDRVSLGILQKQRIRIRAVSHSGQFDRRASLMRLAAEAMEEALDQRATVVFPPAREGAPLVARSHEALAREAEAGGVATFPLEARERRVGALTLERAPGLPFDAPSLELAGAVAAVCGPIVALKLAGERGLATHAVEATTSFWQKLAGPRHALLKVSVAGTVLAALFLLFATGTYRVSADATVEGEVQRAISAPIAGFVKEAPRRAGDTVKKGEVIGRFDDRELKLERVKLLGQQGQYGKQYREAMAQHNRAQAAIVTAQLEQVEAQLALVDEQLARIEMVAPFDGVIVSGDLSQRLGAPVERGQVLFEVAPLDNFRIALQVDEHDFAEVLPGQRGELAVSSMPHQRFAFTVTKITAVNNAKDGANRFRVEARLDVRPERLRPGMEGVGKIAIDERRLIWIWTHGLVDRIRLWLWASLP
jgi:multidrug efflux pump subunit AcrA (membrane-fusion protein)